MRKLKFWFAIVSSMFLCGAGHADIDDFLKTSIGARPAGLGGAFVPLADSPASVYWNPAGITQLKGINLEGMYTNQFGEGITKSFFSAVRAPFGLAVITNSKGDLPVVNSLDANGDPVISEYTTFSQMALFGSYAYKLLGAESDKGLSLGLSGKLVSSKLYTESYSGFGADLGALYKGTLMQDTGFGIGANMVNAVAPKFGNEAAENYVNFGVSAGRSFANDSDITLSVSSILKNKLAVGAEYTWKMIALRAGMGANDTALGLSFTFERNFSLTFDYALSIHEFGNSHLISLQFAFAKPKEDTWNYKKPEKTRKSDKVKDKETAKKEEPAVKPAKKEENNVKQSNLINIAIADFKSKNVSASDASIVTDFLRTALVKTDKYSVMDRDNMEYVLAEQKFQLSGCTSQECAAKMGRILNVSFMIVGSVSKLQNTYYITANMVNVETGKIIKSETQKAMKTGELQKACNKIALDISK